MLRLVTLGDMAATRTAKPRMRAPDRREQILATARRLFAQRGYDDTSIDGIAAAIRVSKPIIYRHFDGKRDLHLAVLEEHLADLVRRLWVALSTSPDPRERLHAGLEAYFEFADQREDGFRMLVDAGARNDPAMRERLGIAWDTLAEGITRTVGDLLRAADPNSPASSGSAGPPCGKGFASWRRSKRSAD